MLRSPCTVHRMGSTVGADARPATWSVTIARGESGRGVAGAVAGLRTARSHNAAARSAGTLGLPRVPRRRARRADLLHADLAADVVLPRRVGLPRQPHRV